MDYIRDKSFIKAIMLQVRILPLSRWTMGSWDMRSDNCEFEFVTDKGKRITLRRWDERTYTGYELYITIIELNVDGTKFDQVTYGPSITAQYNRLFNHFYPTIKKHRDAAQHHHERRREAEENARDKNRDDMLKELF